MSTIKISCNRCKRTPDREFIMEDFLDDKERKKIYAKAKKDELFKGWLLECVYKFDLCPSCLKELKK